VAVAATVVTAAMAAGFGEGRGSKAGHQCKEADSLKGSHNILIEFSENKFSES
jgi:hypothetical protein